MGKNLKSMKCIMAWILILCMSIGVVQMPVYANAAPSDGLGAPVNVARGKGVSLHMKDGQVAPGGYYNPDRPASMAVDGISNNVSGNYCDFGPQGSGVSERVSMYLQVDLGAVYDLSSIKLWRYWEDARTYDATVIAVSETEDFTSYHILYNSDTAGVHGFGGGTDPFYQETSEGKEFNFTAVTPARYVRVYGYGKTGTGVTNHINEVEIYGYERTGNEEEKVELDKNSAKLKVGETVSLTATVFPLNTEDKSVAWTSDNEAVATVANGVVTAVKAGTAKITATAVNGKAADCTIMVNEVQNVAQGKAVAAYKTADNTAAPVNPDPTVSSSKAVDGIIAMNNYFDFGDQAGSGGIRQSLYAQVDLKGSYLLSDIEMWRYWNQSRVYDATAVVVSNDKEFKSYTVIYNSDTENVHGLGNGTDQLYGETAGGKVFAVPGEISARYVRVYTYGVKNGGVTNHIVELKVNAYVFGDEVQPEEPDNSKIFQNAKVPLYLEGPGTNNQVTHPDVVVMDGSWNGYRYWMAYTPNKSGTSYYENPCIAASNDGTTWEFPAENPIQPRFDSSTQNENEHNCDTDIVYDPVNNRMIMYWEWANDIGVSMSEIRYRISYNGVNWGIPGEDGQLKTGSRDYGVAIHTEGSKYSDLSPAILYDKKDQMYKMWANDAGDVGYGNKEKNKVWYRTSKDGLTNWSDKIYVNNFLGKNEDGLQLYPWHQDIQWVDEFQEYWALQQAFPQGSNPDNSSLRLAKSKDGINWEPVSTKALLKVGEAGAWDAGQIYRSTFWYEPSSVYGQGTFHIWYGGLSEGKTRWDIGYTSANYADVIYKLTGEAVAQENRITVDNEHPLLVVPLYGKTYSESGSVMDWGDTLVGRWNAIPDDLKKYTVLELHLGPIGRPDVKAFYEQQLDIAQENNIPIFIVSLTAGDSNYTATGELDLVWAEEMLKKYSALKGFMSTENYWIYGSNVAQKSADYLRLCKKYGAYYMWSEHKRGTLETIINYEYFRTALEEAGDHFIFTYKNTPSSTGDNPGSASYMLGLWLTGYCSQWGGLMDTWKWWERKEWKLFEASKLPGLGNGGEEDRCVATEPEAMLAMEMMTIYNNGGCVYNFEHPAYTYGINNKNTPAFDNGIAQFMRYAIENPAPSKQDIKDQTKIFVNAQLSSTGNIYEGLSCDDPTMALYQSGRYGLIPAVPAVISEATIRNSMNSDIIILKNTTQLTNKAQRTALFQEAYPETYTGDGFAQKVNNAWLMYNSNENVNKSQSATIKLEGDKTFKADMTPHTYVILNEENGIYNIKLNNYRVDKDEIWAGYTSSSTRWNTDVNTLFQDWLSSYIASPKDSAFRNTVITLEGLSKAPSVAVTAGLQGQYGEPVVSYDSAAKKAVITISSNGWVDLTVLEGVEADNTYTITLPAGAGYQVIPYGGYTTTVKKYDSFRFLVLIDSGNGYTGTAAVKANGIALTADADHIYTIGHITANQFITVEGVQKQQYTVSFPEVQTGYRVELQGGDSGIVSYGGHVRFKVVLEAEYNESTPTVTLNADKELTPDSDGIFEIANIIGDIVVTVNGVKKNDVQTTDEQGKKIYLSDIGWKSAINSVGAAGEDVTPKKDLNHNGDKIRLKVNGEVKEFDKGIGTQSESEIIYNIAGKGYLSFYSLVGVDYSRAGDIATEVCDVRFKVYLDGRQVYDSGLLDPSDNAREVKISLNVDNKELKLVTLRGVNPYSDWGNWADANLVMGYPEPENLALNKTVTVKKTADHSDSEVNKDRPAAMAVDGIKNNTLSNYCDFGKDGDNASRYLQVDLGQIYELSQINMWRYWQDGRTYNGTVIAVSKTADFATPFIIYNSDTGNKHNLGTGTDTAYAETSAGKSFPVPAGTEGRYIRVYMAGSQKGVTNHIVEIEVMGYVFDTDPVPYKANALENSSVYFDLPTHYDTSDHVSGQVTHPDVTVMDGKWSGYKYWMVYTPNVMQTSRHEQPSIVASNDGLHWVEVASNNPIEVEPVSTRYHNNDGDMVYDPVNDRMMVFWKWDDDQSGGVGSEIRLRISYDGVHWGKPVDKDGNIAAAKDAVVSVNDDPSTGYITVIKAKARYDMLSPTFTYDEHRGIFVMWANNAGDVGYYNGQNNFVEMRWSYDGLTWSERTKVNNFLGKNEAGQQLAPWHQDIQYVPEFQEYWGLSQCFAGNSPDGSVLYLTKSKDGINWQQVVTKPVLNAGKSGAWDDFQIYRSTFYYDAAGTADPKKGVLRVWYSGLQQSTAGQMVIDSSGNKTIRATSADTRIWRVGYTENDYAAAMKALTKDEYYGEPDTVVGTKINLALSKPTLTIGEEAQISAAFVPETTSDQIVKYTSKNPNIATVDAMGKIKGVADGATTIVAVNRSGLTGEVIVTVGELQKGKIRFQVSKDHPMYLENYYWSDDALNKDGLDANKNYFGDERIDSPVKLYGTVPKSLKDNTVILLIAERSLNNTDAVKEWIKKNVELCNENQVPCAVQIANGETNSNNTIPLSFWDELARDNEYLYGFNAAEMYNRFQGDNRNYIMDVIRVGIPHGVTMMWTDTNIFGTNGVIYDWLTQDTKLADLMRENKEYISLMTKESYGSKAANTDALFMGMWLTEYCDNWGIASDWWHWQLDGNGKLFDGSGGDAWKQCLTWPENMYTQDVVLAASQGATCFKSEAQWYSNATKGMRTPTYQYSMIPFLEKLVSGEVKIPGRTEVLARTKAIVVGAENWNGFNYDTAYSNLYPKTGQYGIVPFVPSTCPAESLAGYELVVRSNHGNAGLQALLDTVYPVQKSAGTAFMENYGDTWYWMNSSEDKDVSQYTEFTTPINGSEGIRIEGAPHVFGIIKERPAALNVYLSNYRVDKTELWNGTYPQGFGDQACYNYVWVMCNRMLQGTGLDEQKRNTVITVKNAVEPQLKFITKSPADRGYAADNYVRPYSYSVVPKAGSADEWVITVSHNGIVEFDIITGDSSVQATSVELSKGSIDVIRNKSASVQAAVLPANAGNKQITWSVKDNTIAAVDNQGNVIGLKEGKTTLRAAVSGSVYAECEVNVIDLKVTGVKMNKESATLSQGDSIQLSAAIFPEDNSDGSITWTSSNEKVATVTESGKVIARSAGVANIVAQSAYEAKGITTVTVDYALSVVLDRTNMAATANSEHALTGAEGPAKNVLDGKTGTIWHTSYKGDEVPKPHWIKVTLGGTKKINKFAYMPRALAGNGTFLKYILYYTDTMGTEHEITRGEWVRSADIKYVEFAAVKATAVRLQANGSDSTATVGGFGSAEEINIYEASEKPSAKAIADNIKEIAPVKETDTKVTVPVLKGFNIAISASSHPKIVATDGTITRPESDTIVTLTLKVTGDNEEETTEVKILIQGTGQPEVVPETPEVVPETPEVVPETPEVIPEKPEVVPEKPEVVPEKPGTVPEKTEPDKGAEEPKTTVAAVQGKTYTYKEEKYKVADTSAKNRTVTFMGTEKKTNKSVNIPGEVKIGKDTYKVTAVAGKAFKGNNKLEKVTIGNNVKTIGSEAFYNAKGLKTVIIRSEVLKSVGKDAFKGTSKNLVIKVPKKKISTYKKLLKGIGRIVGQD